MGKYLYRGSTYKLSDEPPENKRPIGFKFEPPKEIIKQPIGFRPPIENRK